MQIQRIHSEWPLAPVDPNYSGEVASRYRFLDGKGEIGIISSVSRGYTIYMPICYKKLRITPGITDMIDIL